MKGMFTAPRAQPPLKALVSDDSLRWAHQDQRDQVPKSAAEIEQERADAVAAARVAQGLQDDDPPPQVDVDPNRTRVIHQPRQRFALDDRTYFVAPRQAFAPRPCTRGEWLVRYYMDDADPSTARPSAVGIEHQLDAPDAIDDGHLDAEGPLPKPDLRYAQEHTHFRMREEDMYEVGELWLRPRMVKAEQADYAFAVRMQGLQNGDIAAVWATEDTGEEPRDRAEMLELFLQKYLTRFLTQAPLGQNDPDTIVQEALQMHRQFCKVWGLEHQRGLSRPVEAAAEALVGMFYERHLKRVAPADMTWMELSRVLRRDPRLAPQFGLCLHFYMVKLEQDRGARNASYKSMYNANSSNLLSLNSMDKFLSTEMAHIRQLVAAAAAPDDRRFHPSSSDWFRVMTQLNRPSVQYTGAKRRLVGAARQQAPWAPGARN